MCLQTNGRIIYILTPSIIYLLQQPESLNFNFNFLHGFFSFQIYLENMVIVIQYNIFYYALQ